MRSLLTTWVFITLCTAILWTVLPALSGVHGETNPLYFLPWPPGIAIAIVMGSMGGMLNGLFRLWSEVMSQKAQSNTLSPGLYSLPPILGAFAGIVLFFFIAAGGLSLGNPSGLLLANTPQRTSNSDSPVDKTLNPTSHIYESPSPASLLYKLTPTTPGQLAILVIYSIAAGYFFARIPELLKIVSDRT
jgi:hypothetical protein